MAEAHYLSDKDGKKFYPYAHASATYDNNGNTVEKRLKALDETTSSAVQSVKIGTTEYKSGTTVTLPSYPTSLPASDVPSWAKQKTKPTYTASEIGLGNVGNFKAVSTVESQGLTDTEKSNARANIGAQVAGSYASFTHNHDDKYQAKGSYASASHTHDDRYYTESEINSKLSGKAESIVLASDTNLNNITTPGIYSCGGGNSIVNKPSGVDAIGLIVVHNATGSYYTQILTNSTDTNTYRRTCNNGTWSAWTQDKYTDTNTWRPQSDWNATSGDAVIKNKPTIPSVGNGTVTITQNGTSKGTFTMNQSGNTTIALTDTNTDTNTVTNIGTTSSNYTNGNILIQGSGATTVSKSGNTVTISSTNTDTNTWRPLGTTADTACAGNDSRLSNARPANGGTATYANYVYATSHQGSWYQNSQWDGTYFQTNYKNGNNVLPMKVNNAGYADSAGSASSVAWSNVSGRPSSLPANGGNSTTVNGHTVNSNVPANAKFTDTTYAIATTSANGLMSKDMVTKLNGIASGATAVTSTTVSNWGFKKTDTNTWRGVQNNLTSTATDQSLSAYQGKVLRDMIHRVIVQSSEPTISTNDEWLLEY